MGVVWLAWVTPASADAVAVGPDGAWSIWRLLGGDSAPEAAPLDLACGRCSLAVHDSPYIDLRRLRRRAQAVFLGARLRTEEPTTLHLFVGFAGRLQIWLDGRSVLDATRGRLRKDDVHVPLSLGGEAPGGGAPGGEHRLVLRFEPPEEGRRGRRAHVRVLDAGLAPGTGDVRIDLGPLPDDVASRSLRLREHHRLREGEPEVTLELTLPGGGPATPVPIVLRQGESETRSSLTPARGRFGTWRSAMAMPERGALRARLEAAGARLRLGRGLARDRLLLRAAHDLDDARREAPDSAKGPLQWRSEEMQRVIAEGDPDGRWRTWLRSDAGRIVRALRRGRNPFGAPRGYQRMAHVSALDGSAQPYELFVPPAYRGRRSWPLVITLHGYKGNAGDYFRNTFGLPRDYENGESLEDHGRHGTAPTRGPMIVIAPQGRGQTYYRHAGEIDILEALADARARFRVDPRRIYITGGSMGGTGAAYLPFRHPDLFAAGAALAGYHDQRVRQDTHHDGLSAAERFLRAFRSDIDWSENALHIPMLLIRGTRDRPLAWTRRQVARLRALGYDAEHREPELGHNVWTENYADGAIFDWFRRHRRPREPAHVRLRTGRERTSSAYWVRIDGRERSDAFGEVEARLRDSRIVARVEGVDGLTFSPAGRSELEIEVNGQTLRGSAPLSLRRRGDRFEVGLLENQGRKRSGVSGPIRDVYHEPLLFVVGTRDPAHTWMNRRVAKHWARPRGWDVRYPIIDDVDLTPAQARGHALVLVGPPRSNAVLARIAARLPIRFEGDAIRVGEQRHRGTEVGVAFVAPNPEAPERSVLVIAGTTPLGTWRSLSLPDLLPDYVVYDEGVAAARGWWSCGGARRDDGSENGAEPTACRYRAHGFFDMRWRLPQEAVSSGSSGRMN